VLIIITLTYKNNSLITGAIMDLRDYFAARAMQGLLANAAYSGKASDFAILAYEQADAMLEARKVGMDESNDGWIEWKGGECPVEADVNVELKLRSGAIVLGIADHFTWKDHGRDYDIISYRIVK
jgi:hypothetical protein